MTDSPLKELTIKKFREALAKKNISVSELTGEILDYIKKEDGKIKAFLSLREEEAVREATEADEALRQEAGPLIGVPLAIKDNILIKGEITTAGSKILETYKGAYDATVMEKLKREKPVLLGKTNLDEFAMGSSTENSGFQITRNPRDPERVPGGSSGGSAAAVAAGMALGALGSDTFGSIRQPASFCGVVGLKPTYGAVSRSGLIAMTSSMDQIGPIAKTVEDAAILFSAISGYDPMDSTSVSHEYGDEILSPDMEKAKALRIGVPDEYFIEGLDPNVRTAVGKAIDELKALGVKFKKISLPHTKYAVPAYYLSMPAEVSANLARFDGIRYARPGLAFKNLVDVYFKTRGRGFGTEVKRRIILGTFVLSSGYYDAYYARAQKARKIIAQDFEDAFKAVDVILTPVAPTPAFKIGEKINDPLAMYLSDIFTGPVNLAGLPAISIPTKGGSGLPIGFQLIGRKFREADILALGRLYESG